VCECYLVRNNWWSRRPHTVISSYDPSDAVGLIRKPTVCTFIAMKASHLKWEELVWNITSLCSWKFHLRATRKKKLSPPFAFSASFGFALEESAWARNEGTVRDRRPWAWPFSGVTNAMLPSSMFFYFFLWQSTVSIVWQCQCCWTVIEI
jgi:hypothetical protein